MFSALFGNYLLNKGVVSAEELTTIMEQKQNTRLKLGILAINAGFMTSDQVEQVHELQTTMDKRFGEIAVEKEFMTDAQVMELLGQQKEEYLILAQVLIESGHMTMATFEEEVNLYKLERGLTDQQFEAIRKGNIDVIIPAFVAFEKTGSSEFYIDFVKLFVKNIIRFVDSNVYVDRVERIDSVNYLHLFEQRLTDQDNDKVIYTAFSGEDKALINLASKHAEEDFDDLSEYPLDSAAEFLNLTNGLFLVNMSGHDKKMSMDIQQYVHNASHVLSHDMYRIPVHTSAGTLYLIVGEEY